MTNDFKEAVRERQIWIENKAAELVRRGFSPWKAIQEAARLWAAKGESR